MSDIREFVSDLTIAVISCFEVRPRIRRNEDETSIADRKAFRLMCIYEDDCGRLMDAAAWPDSVTVSEWYFKTPSDAADRRQQVKNNDNARRPTRPPAPASSSTPTEGVELGTGTDDVVTISATPAAAAAPVFSNPVVDCGAVT